MTEIKTRKLAVVAGASGGIGRAVTTELIDLGFHVAGLGRNVSAMSLESKHFTGKTVDFENLDNLVNSLSDLTRDLDVPEILVSTLGFGRFGAIEQFSASQIRRMIDVNLTSQLLLVRSFIPAMKRQQSGRIVFIGSESALTGRRYGSIYSATKFAIRGVAQALRAECATQGVHVSIINPGLVRTSFFDELEFEPGPDADNALEASDVARAVGLVVSSRSGSVVDEINLSPTKNVVRHKKN